METITKAPLRAFNGKTSDMIEAGKYIVINTYLLATTEHGRKILVTPDYGKIHDNQDYLELALEKFAMLIIVGKSLFLSSFADIYLFKDAFLNGFHAAFSHCRLHW